MLNSIRLIFSLAHLSMSPYYSFNDVRKRLSKSVHDPKKLEFILGYLEGQAERFGDTWRISSSSLDTALKHLGFGRESSASIYRQVRPADVSKIEKHLKDKPIH